MRKSKRYHAIIQTTELKRESSHLDGGGHGERNSLKQDLHMMCLIM